MRRHQMTCQTLLQMSMAVLALFAQVPAALAKDYKVNVTRKESQLYKVTGKEVYIFTSACFEFVYYSDAILRMYGRRGTIVFPEEESSCDVRAVYGETELAAGTYTVSLTHETDDWYSVDGTDLVIHTFGCYEYWYGEEVLLRVKPGGGAVIIDEDDEVHAVEGIFNVLVL